MAKYTGIKVLDPSNTKLKPICDKSGSNTYKQKCYDWDKGSRVALKLSMQLMADIERRGGRYSKRLKEDVLKEGLHTLGIAVEQYASDALKYYKDGCEREAFLLGQIALLRVEIADVSNSLLVKQWQLDAISNGAGRPKRIKMRRTRSG